MAKAVSGKYDYLFESQIKNGLHINLSVEDILHEWQLFQKTPGKLNVCPNQNKIVLYFQQDIFYKKEKEMFSSDPELRTRLVENRVKYLFKPAEKINDYELLRGFKISREWSSYSHFSPLWTKYFVEQNSLKCVADPFGGWGHHMVGVLAAGAAYIYNDLSHSTVEGVRKIAEFLRGDTEIYEGDAAEFVIPDRCDGVFMCPPYYNTEIYECGKFNSRQEYDALMRKVIQNYLDSCANTLGIIIREDYEYLFDKLMETTGGWKKKEPVNKMLDHMTKEGKINEFLYTFVKDNTVTEKNAKLW